MSSSIRRMLWGAFAGLTLLVAAGVAFTIAVLRMEQRVEYAIVQQSRPLVDAVRTMDVSLTSMVSATRGYQITRETAFEQQYADAAREFDKAKNLAFDSVVDPRDRQLLNEFNLHYIDIKRRLDQQLKLVANNR